MEILTLAVVGGFVLWYLRSKAAADAAGQQADAWRGVYDSSPAPPDAVQNQIAQAQKALNTLSTPQQQGMFQKSMFELPGVSGATIDRGLPRIMKIAPKAHWWTSRFQTGTMSSVAFQNDDDLVSVGLFPKGSIVAYLGITTQAGCDSPTSNECQFQRSYVTGARTDGTMLLGWVESSDLVDV